MSKPFRLAVVNSHPIQYFAPLYAYIDRDQALEMTALYCSDFSLRGGIDPGFKQAVTWDVDLLSGYRSHFLGERAKMRTPRGFWSLVCPEVWTEVRSGRYDALMLHGYAYAADVIAFFAAKSRGLPVFMRSETHLGLQRSERKRQLRDSVLSWAYRFVDGFMAIGTLNRNYYRALGVPERKIHDVPYTVDNDRFIAASRISFQEREAIRIRYGLPLDRPVVLYASKFMRRKHPDDVIRAMKLLRDEGIVASLLLIGTGAMEADLREIVASEGVQDVVFGGFVNQSDLPGVYAASDIFVLPSEDEPWGLIVNEVMCASLPVVVADEVGCVPDLVHQGENGFLMQAGNVASLVDALRPLLVSEEVRRTMGSRSLETIKGWNYARCLQGIREAAAKNRGEDANE